MGQVESWSKYYIIQVESAFLWETGCKENNSGKVIGNSRENGNANWATGSSNE